MPFAIFYTVAACPLLFLRSMCGRVYHRPWWHPHRCFFPYFIAGFEPLKSWVAMVFLSGCNRSAHFLYASHRGQWQPICDPKGCATVLGVVGGGDPPSLTQTLGVGGSGGQPRTRGGGGSVGTPTYIDNAFCAPQGLRNLFYCRLFRKQTR